MTLVVADSGPIRYLVVIGLVDVLPQLYKRVVLPAEVVVELTHPNAPAEVQNWASRLPGWIEVRNASQPDSKLIETLDAGEAAAIALAKEIRADMVLLDEKEARHVAVGLNLRISGTIGVLEAAAELGLISLADSFRKLLGTNFRIDPGFLRDALARDEARRKLDGGVNNA